jgi:hypothetical protein
MEAIYSRMRLNISHARALLKIVFECMFQTQLPKYTLLIACIVKFALVSDYQIILRLRNNVETTLLD